MLVRVQSPWDGDTPLAAKLWPAHAWHGSPQGKAVVLYREVPAGLLADGRFTVVKTEGEMKAALQAAKQSYTPCIHLGPVVKERSACQGGDVHACAIHGECARNRCKDYPSCFDGAKLCNDYAAPWAMLLTGGIGDVFTLEAMLTDSQRATLTTIYYAAPAAKELEAIFRGLPNYPKLANHVVLPSGRKTHFAAADVESDHGKIDAADWSIATIFPRNLPYTNSSLLTHAVASRPSLPPYVAIVPVSTWGRWPGRNFDDADWQECFAFLELYGLRGVVLNREKVALPYHPLLLDFTAKADILESVELLKGAMGYLGIDSALSVLAAKLFPANRLAVKAVRPKPNEASNLDRWKQNYYAPHKTFEFIRPRLEAPTW